jgi:hypothetical protein
MLVFVDHMLERLIHGGLDRRTTIQGNLLTDERDGGRRGAPIIADSADSRSGASVDGPRRGASVPGSAPGRRAVRGQLVPRSARAAVSSCRGQLVPMTILAWLEPLRPGR